MLLESTAEPLIPYNLHNVCLSAATNYLQCKQVNRIDILLYINIYIFFLHNQIHIYFSHLQIVMQLPETRRTVFLYISSFLQELLSHTQDNELDAKTLGKIVLFSIRIMLISVLLLNLLRTSNHYICYPLCVRFLYGLFGNVLFERQIKRLIIVKFGLRKFLIILVT